MNDLISRQAAIDALEREKTYCTAFRDGYTPINVFEKYNAGLTDGIKALKNLPSAKQWIPCSERLPEEIGSYPVWTARGFGNHLSTSYWDGKEWSLRVVAWMPSPDPYKAERGEE